MHYYLLSQKGWSRLIFPNQSKALGGVIMPIASSVGLSEAPKALSESHRSLHQGKLAAVSDILDNPEKNVFFFSGLLRVSVLTDEKGHQI